LRFWEAKKQSQFKAKQSQSAGLWPEILNKTNVYGMKDGQMMNDKLKMVSPAVFRRGHLKKQSQC